MIMFNFCTTIFILIVILLIFGAVSDSDSWHLHQYVRQDSRKFEQKSSRFWQFDQVSNTWVEVNLPYDLVSCVNHDNCTKVNTLYKIEEQEDEKNDIRGEKGDGKSKDDVTGVEGNSFEVLPLRKRISLMKMSEKSIWVTGQSGSIYERFWNGLQWVVAPHDLPVSAGYAASIFIVNQTILALSENGHLYQMQLSEDSQPIWIGINPVFNNNMLEETEQSYHSATKLTSGISSRDKMRMYFCTKNGLLIELSGIDPPRWTNHGRPPGANIAAIADVKFAREEVVFILSTAGHLYEYEHNSKPPWRKHIVKEQLQDIVLKPLQGCVLHGLVGAHSLSLFLLTKAGNLVERRFHQRKWKWISHGSPNGHTLASITCLPQDTENEDMKALFVTSAVGHVFEFRAPKHSGTETENQDLGAWANHMHPPHAKVARGIGGIQLQPGRMIFPLDDGRLGELHLSGLGGDTSGPNNQVNIRRKSLLKYVWSILDAPETEGWNAEYCTEEIGPLNCITGIKDGVLHSESAILTTRRHKGTKSQQNYLLISAPKSSSSKSVDCSTPDHQTNKVFRLRVMHGDKSFFLITTDGMTFEYLNTENVWFWLKHEHSTAMRGAVGNYNGSLFLVDDNGSLLIRERSSNDLAWINCTSMRKGRHVMGGPPWDGLPGRPPKATAEDALFFVSKTGRLLQFSVALRKFKWKDRGHPGNTRVACIIDQEIFRDNIVFVVGRNGKLYQYNKVTELWHEHQQSQHLVLATMPGTAMRPSSLSLKGSLFMLSEDGRLVEYHWNSVDGWNWIEHGTPDKSVSMVGSPGPCFENAQLFLISLDGRVYLRFWHQEKWKWRDYGFPYVKDKIEDDGVEVKDHDICTDQDVADSFQKIEENCDPKVAPTRPIPFAEDAVIFELRDGRLAEMRRVGETDWVWSRAIGTPTSLCMATFWTALAS